MNLSQIKKKYKDILQSQSSSSSSSSFHSPKQSTIPSSFPIPIKHHRTQSVSTKQNKPNITLHTEIIHLKQRLGQANQKLSDKTNQLKSQHQRKSQINDEKRLLEKHLNAYQQQIEKRDKQLVELKAGKIGLGEKLKEMEEKERDQILDRELLKKQIGFYQMEQKKFREVIKEKEEEIKVLINKNKNIRGLESENQRLKNDIKRLVALLEDKKVFKSTKNFNMSYLGKNHQTTESDSWYNRDTISSAQNFLTKHRINQKPILNGLVKLIQTLKMPNKPNANNKSVRKSIDCRSKSINQSVHNTRSKSKNKHRRRDSSVTYKDISMILPNHTTSSKNHNRTQLSIYNDSLFHSKSKITNDKSVYMRRREKKDKEMTIEDDQKVFNCREVVKEYKAEMDQLLDKKVCSKGRIRKLTEWLVDSVDNVIKEKFITFQ